MSGSLICRNHQIWIGLIMTHNSWRMNDLTLNLIVSNIKQTTDQNLIQFIRFSTTLSPVSDLLLHSEATFCTFWNDQYILNHLSGNQIQNLTTEIGSIRPANTTTSNL